MPLEIHEAPADRRQMISRYAIENYPAGYVKKLLLDSLDVMEVGANGFVILTPATLDLVGDRPEDRR